MGVEDLIAKLEKFAILRRRVKHALTAQRSPDRRISRDTSDRYIARACQKVLLEYGQVLPSGEMALSELLGAAIQALVASDERKLRQIIEITDWPALTKKLLVLTIRRHGSRMNRYGASADDYVQEAIALFLECRRHYPVDPPELTLFKFSRAPSTASSITPIRNWARTGSRSGSSRTRTSRIPTNGSRSTSLPRPRIRSNS